MNTKNIGLISYALGLITLLAIAFATAIGDRPVPRAQLLHITGPASWTEQHARLIKSEKDLWDAVGTMDCAWAATGFKRPDYWGPMARNCPGS